MFLLFRFLLIFSVPSAGWVSSEMQSAKTVPAASSAGCERALGILGTAAEAPCLSSCFCSHECVVPFLFGAVFWEGELFGELPLLSAVKDEQFLLILVVRQQLHHADGILGKRTTELRMIFLPAKWFLTRGGAVA